MSLYDDLLQALGEAEGSDQYQEMVNAVTDTLGDAIATFCSLREEVMNSVTLPTEELEPGNFGDPPLAIDDGETFYAVIFADGQVVPLPFGYEFTEDDFALDETAALLSTPAFSLPSGLIRYIPLSDSFELPGDQAFELERLIEKTGSTDNENSALEFDGVEFLDDVFLDADSGEPFTGKAVSHWPDGTLKKEGHFVDGALNGKLSWWNENGEKELVDHYVDSVRHGEHRAWHDNGKRRAEGNSVDGGRQGTWRWWHANGELAERLKYEDGLEQGKHQKWYENGQKKYEAGYVDGELHGTVRYWDDDGDLIAESQWIAGDEQDSDEQDDLAWERIENLKETLFGRVESDELRSAMGALIAEAEEAAEGNPEAIEEMLHELIDYREERLADRGADVDER